MSLKNFTAYLQQLLSMIEPGNTFSIGLAKAALSAASALSQPSWNCFGSANNMYGGSSQICTF